MTFKVSFNLFCFRTLLSSIWQTNHIQGDSRDHWQMELQLHDVSKMKHLEDLVPCRSILKGRSLWLLENIQFQMFRKRPMFYFSFFSTLFRSLTKVYLFSQKYNLVENQVRLLEQHGRARLHRLNASPLLHLLRSVIWKIFSKPSMLPQRSWHAQISFFHND